MEACAFDEIAYGEKFIDFRVGRVGIDDVGQQGNEWVVSCTGLVIQLEIEESIIACITDGNDDSITS